MSKYFILWLLSSIVVWGLPGCSDAPGNKEARATVPNQYFDVTGFVQAQIKLLNEQKPEAVKKVTETGRSSETKKMTDLNWASELGVFLELDLNKPAFRNAYTINRQQEPITGDVTLTYRPKPGFDNNIQYLIIRTDAAGQVKALKGLQVANNPLLTTRRELQLTTQAVNGRNQIISYQIQGRQKPIIFPELRYLISTQLQ